MKTNHTNTYELEENKDKLIDIGLIDEPMINESYQQYGSIIGYNNGVIGFNNMKFMRKYIKSAINMNELINNNFLKDNVNKDFFIVKFNR
mgnify:CR=1 FL=1